MVCYKGSCHCDAVTFKIDAAIEGLITCDCSLCRRKNAVMTKPHESELEILSGEDLLAAYEWNKDHAKHFFCSRCGVYTFHRKRAASDHFGINVFCLEHFDITPFSTSRDGWRRNACARQSCAIGMARPPRARVSACASVTPGTKTNKNAASIRRRRSVSIMAHKEEFHCPWQAWQRPTLPGLEP